MHWIFVLVAALNIATGLLYVKRKDRKYATLSFLVAIVVLILGLVFKP